ncbi:MAG: L-lactate dehydrogenase [Deltaproteobacteria bacterium]|nr:L-lactate dehydrogenase [Deltaproteobacteria bacterium]MBW2307634.1 L-lactate dehydrogenase [Deltaproteobacteria bacterium]
MGSGQKTCTNKVAIIGAGMVGATFAYSLMIRGLASEIVLIDINAKRAEGEAMDINHAMPFASPAKIYAGTYKDCRDAALMVITAGAAQKSGESRLALAEKNVAIFKEIIPKIIQYNSQGIVIIVTNPVDILTYVTLKLSGLSSQRVMGSGAILDTARFRFEIGRKFEVSPRNVHAYIIGEHGDSELPVWSSATIAGVRIKDYCPLCGMEYHRSEMEEIFERVRTAAYDIIDRKGATYYAIALGLVQLAGGILRDENAVFTVSSLIQDFYGVNGVCLSVPSIVNRNGIRQVLKIPLDDSEMEKLKSSASVLKEILASLDI